MPAKTALIVDDSKTAQFKLKRTLETYELSIDFAISAEDALSYLSYRVPDIIFMDHSMKGMNGLDAVKIIKSNPATATIPVVMYTAESGDVYLSQARAIGAIDVLSKDVMTASDIQRVMKSINVAQRADKLAETKVATKSVPILEVSKPRSDAPEHSETTRELLKIRDQVAKSMDIQQGLVRRDIQDNTRVMINRFMREIRSVREDLARQAKNQRSFNMAQLTRDEPRSKPANHVWVFTSLALLAAIAGYSVLELSNVKNENQKLVTQTRLLNDRISEQAMIISQARSLSSARSLNQAQARVDDLLSALVWAINEKGQVRFSEQALGDERLEMISGLVDHLDNVNFTGTLSLDVYSGNFCVVLDDSGQLSLPSSPIPATSCQLLSDTAQAFDTTSQTSVSFVNFLNSTPIVERGDLKILIRSHGVDSPSQEYPVLASSTSSDEWNMIASSNNRLNVSLQPR